MDVFLLRWVYQPITNTVWRYFGKSRFFLAWFCFGISFVSLCLDVYINLRRPNASAVSAVFAGPLVILLLWYVCRTSAYANGQTSRPKRIDTFDRVIRTVTILSALAFLALDIVVLLAAPHADAANQTFAYVVYALACSSALYFLEAKPPSAELTWAKTLGDGRRVSAR